MNKKIMLDNNVIILFIFNILIIFLSIILKFCYTKMNYYNLLVKSIFILNLIIFFIGIVFNLLLLFKKKYDIKKIIVFLLIVYIFLNVVFINLMNNMYNSKYYNISKNLLDYCKAYKCDKYETTSLGNVKDFIIYKNYFDYNNLKNDIKIHTTYDTSKIISIKVFVYSDNELYSEQLIYNVLNEYFLNFKIDISSENIKEAFLKRDEKIIKEDNISYKVKSIYKEGMLDKFETIIHVDL